MNWSHFVKPGLDSFVKHGLDSFVKHGLDSFVKHGLFQNILPNRILHHDACQGAFHVVNREDLRREIELLLGVAAYSLLPWRGGATLFCFTRRKCRRDP